MVVACGQKEIESGTILQDLALDCTPFALDRFLHTCRAAAAAAAAQWFKERCGQCKKTCDLDHVPARLVATCNHFWTDAYSDMQHQLIQSTYI